MLVSGPKTRYNVLGSYFQYGGIHMKKKSFSLLLILSLLCTLLSGCAKTQSFSLEDYVKTMDYHDGFTILQLTDIHWNTATQAGDDTYGCEKYLQKLIAEATSHAGRIDLIEVTGDTFMLSNPDEIKEFVRFMESLGIPYAMGWGNHDRQGRFDPNWLSKVFMESKNCLYTELDNDDISQRGNYIINLTGDDGAVKWQIVNLDSGSSYRESATEFGLDYDFIRQDQFDWMTREHDLVGKDVPAICYYHIPQGDNQIGYDAVMSGDSRYKSKFFKLESFASSSYCSTTEDVFLANNVKGAFMGHAHANDFTFTTPSGIVYGLGVKTGGELYFGKIESGSTEGGFEVDEDFDLLGASLVTLCDTEGDFTLEHLYLNERDDDDFVRWVEY